MYSTALETLRLLEWRLARLEFYLSNEDEPPEERGPGQDSVSSRLARLERRFEDICSKYPAAGELLRLYDQLPDVKPETETDAPDLGPSPSNKLQIVLASASAYPKTVSALNNLREYPVPDPRPFASLITLQSNIDKARTTQDVQAQQVDDLTQRSASLLVKWYKSRILEGGEQWSHWEDRLAKVEQRVRRIESSVEREDG